MEIILYQCPNCRCCMWVVIRNTKIPTEIPHCFECDSADKLEPVKTHD
jgi:hypothetical protein